MLDSSADAIIGNALDGTISSWNHGAETLFGYSAAQAIGQPMWMLGPEFAGEEVDILSHLTKGEKYEAKAAGRNTVRFHSEAKAA
ncbi:MAG: PAS domain S-box protein [Rhodoferax sp.]|nr:PAS domain S-box protein [Rhodoferax sp.]